MESKLDGQDLVQMAHNYRMEAESAKRDRMEQNKINMDAYHMRRTGQAKKSGQSNEFLPKLSMAVEQGTNFIQQGLIDVGVWFRVMPEEGLNPDLLQFKPDEIRKLLLRQLNDISFYNIVGNAAKTAFLNSLMIFKVHGELVPKAEYVSQEVFKRGKKVKQLLRRNSKVWQLKIDLVRQEDYYPDPTGRGLYEMEDSYMDAHELLMLAEADNSPYDLAEVKKAIEAAGANKVDDQHKRNRETGQNSPTNGYRKQVKITEIWGNFLNAEGKLVHENCVATIANDQFVIRKPTPNPFWHKQSPYVAIPLLSVPFSVWHKALMDAPAMLNKALNELFNLMLDGGLMSVHGIKQLREDWLDNPDQVTDGIPPGTTLLANSSTPPGMKVLERVDTSTVPPEAFNMYNIASQEFNVSALTNDLRQGAQSFRAVKATEVVEASNALTSMFTGMVKNIESGLDKVLKLSWMVQAQHFHLMNPAMLRALFGTRRFAYISEIPREELFEETVDGVRFQTFGISETLNKQKDFTKLQAFLQTVGSSPVLLEEFVRGGNSLGKLLEQIMYSLDINPDKLKSDDGKDSGRDEEDLQRPEQPSPMEAMVNGEADMQSQIPQAGAASNQGDLTPQSAVPPVQFPGSPATTGQGG